MGRPKLSLQVGDRTVLEHVIRAVQFAGIQTVLVVIGPGDVQTQTLAKKAGAQVLELGAATAEMRDTVERGLQRFLTLTLSQSLALITRTAASSSI